MNPLYPIAGLGRFTWFAARLLRTTGAMLLGRFGAGALGHFKDLTVLQIWFAGVQALWLCLGLGVILAGVALVLGHGNLASFGAEEYFGELLRIAVIGELAPLLTALVVIARSGTAITAELGRMTIGNEVDGLAVHGVDPLAYLGAPRLLGVAIANLALTILVVLATYGGTVALSPAFETVSRQVFASRLLVVLTPQDAVIGVLKGVLFGLTIPMVSIYHGVRMKRDPNEIPRVGPRAVVRCLMAVFAIDGLITAGLGLG